MPLSLAQAFQLAQSHHRTGRFADAETLYRQILQLQPSHAPSLYGLGLIAIAASRYEAALPLLSQALQQSPGQPFYHTDLGVALHRLGRLEEAVVYYQRALALHPDLPAAQINLGDALLQLGRLDEALAASRQGAERWPQNPVACNNYGNALAQSGRPTDAIRWYERALALQPTYVKAIINCGNAQNAAGRPDEAIASYQRALALDPASAETHSNLGALFLSSNRLDEAASAAELALALDPHFADAHVNLGIARLRQRAFEPALRSLRQAIALSPDSVLAHWNLALALLHLEQYAEGWREYEWRWRHPDFLRDRRHIPRPRWDGGPAPGQTIFLHSEQGFGDIIQFVRYVPLVRQRAGAHRVILECQPLLARLLTASSSSWDADLVSHQTDAPTFAPPFDLYLPILSLPQALHLDSPLPAPAPYLQAPADLRALWRTRLCPLPSAPSGSAGATPNPSPAFTRRIGLAWAGNRQDTVLRHRSLTPADFLPLLHLPGLQFYNLIPNSDPAELAPLTTAGLIDLTPHITDFADTAALISELDLIISVDTAAAHLAGALGRPVWLLLQFVADWRWGVEGETIPWYPTMRLFRQPTPNDAWSPVIRAVATNLLHLLPTP